MTDISDVSELCQRLREDYGFGVTEDYMLAADALEAMAQEIESLNWAKEQQTQEIERLDKLLKAGWVRVTQTGIGYLNKLVEQQAQRIAELTQQVDALLAHCPESECSTCGQIVCPGKEWLHFHHDGCPHCWAEEQRKEGGR